MPRFRFNLEDDTIIADRGLHECADELEARLIAEELADRLVQHEPHLLTGGHAIVVRDRENRQIYRAEMDERSILVRRNQN